MAKEFNIATFNVKWFGLGGEISGTQRDEFRGPWIKEYISKNLSQSQAILFQEIVDVDKLKHLMAELNMSCHSYDNSRRNHQHVALCLDNDFSLEKESFEENYAFEELDVTGGSLRPGLRGLIVERRTRKKLFHIMGVHLKANSQSSTTRIKQVKIIAQELNKRKSRIPYVVLGDFNTYNSTMNGRSKDDKNVFDEILSQVKLKYVAHKNEYTYRSKSTKLLLDHAWVSQSVEISSVKVGKSCNHYSRSATRFDSSNFFNRFVSDHCPLSFNLNLK